MPKKKGVGNYKCIQCNELVFLRKGEINRPHFSHLQTSYCSYFTKIIKEHNQSYHDNAIILFEDMWNNDVEIIIKTQCQECDVCKSNTLNKPNFTKKEHSFKFKNKLYRADSADLDNEKNILSIIEIFNTSKTLINARPEPWFEIGASEIYKRTIFNNKINLFNIKDYICWNCKKRKYESYLYDCYINKINQWYNYDLIIEKEYKKLYFEYCDKYKLIFFLKEQYEKYLYDCYINEINQWNNYDSIIKKEYKNLYYIYSEKYELEIKLKEQIQNEKNT